MVNKQVRVRKPVQLYVEAELRTKIEQNAQTAGLTVSSYLANLLRDHFQGVTVQPNPLQRIADLERRVEELERGGPGSQPQSQRTGLVDAAAKERTSDAAPAAPNPKGKPAGRKRNV